MLPKKTTNAPQFISLVPPSVLTTVPLTSIPQESTKVSLVHPSVIQPIMQTQQLISGSPIQQNTSQVPIPLLGQPVNIAGQTILSGGFEPSLVQPIIYPSLVQPSVIQSNLVQTNLVQSSLIRPELTQSTLVQSNLAQPSPIQPISQSAGFGQPVSLFQSSPTNFQSSSRESTPSPGISLLNISPVQVPEPILPSKPANESVRINLGPISYLTSGQPISPGSPIQRSVSAPPPFGELSRSPLGNIKPMSPSWILIGSNQGLTPGSSSGGFMSTSSSGELTSSQPIQKTNPSYQTRPLGQKESAFSPTELDNLFGIPGKLPSGHPMLPAVIGPDNFSYILSNLPIANNTLSHMGMQTNPPTTNFTRIPDEDRLRIQRRDDKAAMLSLEIDPSQLIKGKTGKDSGYNAEKIKELLRHYKLSTTNRKADNVETLRAFYEQTIGQTYQWPD